MFADDTVLYSINSNEKDVLSDFQCDMNNVFNWLSLNILFVNIIKSCTMFVSNKATAEHMNLSMNNQLMESVKETTYLGVTLCDDLSWNKQISGTCSKIGYGINILYRLRFKVSQSDMLRIYNTIIQPYIDYCLTIWGYAPLSQITRVQRLQNRIARIISRNYEIDISPSVLLARLGIMNIVKRRDYFMSI